jgi:hypothetical protein
LRTGASDSSFVNFHSENTAPIVAAISSQVKINIEEVSKHLNEQTSKELEREIFRLKK